MFTEIKRPKFINSLKNIVISAELLHAKLDHRLGIGPTRKSMVNWLVLSIV